MSIRKKVSELPFGNDIVRWGRIQRAGQRFAEVIKRETRDGLSQDQALAHVRQAMLAAQAAQQPEQREAQPASALERALRAEVVAIGGMPFALSPRPAEQDDQA